MMVMPPRIRGSQDISFAPSQECYHGRPPRPIWYLNACDNFFRFDEWHGGALVSTNVRCPPQNGVHSVRLLLMRLLLLLYDAQLW